MAATLKEDVALSFVVLSLLAGLLPKRDGDNIKRTAMVDIS
jgi:hypothetical protein